MASTIEFRNVSINGSVATVEVFATSDVAFGNFDVTVFYDEAAISIVPTVTVGNASGWTILSNDLGGEIPFSAFSLSENTEVKVATLQFMLVDPTQPLTLTASGIIVGNESVSDVEFVLERPPLLTITQDLAEVEENLSGLQIGTLNAADVADPATLTYGVSDERFEVVGGVLKLKDGASLDFEQTSPGGVEVVVTASADNGAYTEQVTVQLGVLDANDAPILEDTVRSIDENSVNGTFIFDAIQGSDQDVEDTLTYTILNGNFNNAFTLNQNSGLLSVNNSDVLDFERFPTYELEVQVTDAAGLSDTAIVTVEVIDVNEAPTAVILDTQVVAENSDGAVIGSLFAEDADANDSHTFSVDDERFEVVDGQLKLKAGVSLDAEAEQFAVTVNVTATDVAGESVTQALMLEVADTNDAPEGIGLERLWIDENSPGGYVSEVFPYDQDGMNDSYQFAVDDDRFELFPEGDWWGLKLKDGVFLDAEQEPEVTFTLTLTDAAGASYSEQFTLPVVDQNDAPVLEDTVRNIDENSVNGTFIFDAIQGSDQDVEDTLTYTILSGNFNNAFTLNQNSGLLSVNNSDVLDFEKYPSYELEVQVTDAAGQSAIAMVTVNVNDVNEAPTSISLSNHSIVGGTAGVVVGALMAEDPDVGNTVTYSLSGADAGRFEIVGDTLKLKDGEVAFSRGDDLQVDVTATDQGGLATSQSFVIGVTPEIELTPTDDVIHAGPEAATLLGRGGDDVLVGGNGDDTLVGGRHNDMLIGGEGFDSAQFTGAAHEYVISLLGDREVDLFNLFLGMDGTAFDTNQAVLSVSDSVPGEDGTDRVQVEKLDFSDVSYTVNGYELELSDLHDQFQGGYGNDWVRGGLGDDTILGGRGDDLLIADAGRDQLGGESGDDILVSAEGANILDGGSDNDYLIVGNADGAMVAARGGSGNDTFVLANQPDQLLNVELIIAGFTSGEDKLDLSGLTQADGSALDFSALVAADNGSSTVEYNIDLAQFNLVGGGAAAGTLTVSKDLQSTDVVFTGGADVTALLQSIENSYVDVV